MTQYEIPDKWIVVYTDDQESSIIIAFECWNAILAAYVKWIGEKRDSILELVTLQDSTFIVSASHITSFLESTSESREKWRQLKALDKAEQGFE